MPASPARQGLARTTASRPRRWHQPAIAVVCVSFFATSARAQAPVQNPVPTSSAPVPARDTEAADVPPAGSPWSVMADGVVFLTSIAQEGPRGTADFVSQNWGMLMASRPVGRSLLTLTGMVSLEPATMPAKGYPEIFQVGETFRGAPLVDYQHPHDFLMQLSAVFRIPVNDHTSLRFVGAPVGEASVGPPAFMHRRSAAENPTAPLSHHSFDSTHIAMGVLGVGIDTKALSLDGSVFHGREPDERRWDLVDFGRLDSWSARVLVRPLRGLEFEGSYAFLKEPEALERQNVKRYTTSLSYTRETDAAHYTAITFAAARSKRTFSLSDALLGEITHRVNRLSVFGRYEGVEVETEHLLFPGLIHTPHTGELIDPLHAVTIGAAVEIARIAGCELAVGGDVVAYKVPFRLQESHGRDLWSSHVFLRLRAPISAMGRMWNMRMSDGMRH